MKLILVLTICLGLALAAPLDPSDEVELVRPVNTNRRDPEIGGSFPILVLHRPRTHSFNGFSDIFGPGFGFEFGRDGQDKEGSSERKCTGLCRFLKMIQDEFDSLEERMKVLTDRARGRENEVEGEEGESARPVVTYEEKVLPDGTVLKINQTSYSSGGSDDGKPFFVFNTKHVYSDRDPEANEDPEENNAERRGRRSIKDAFNQQAEDTSFLQQKQRKGVVPEYNLRDDTRVNDLLLENAMRGGLIRVEPDAELLRGRHLYETTTRHGTTT